MPHLGQRDGSDDVISGCMGQAKEDARAASAPYRSGIVERNARVLSGARSRSASRSAAIVVSSGVHSESREGSVARTPR